MKNNLDLSLYLVTDSTYHTEESLLYTVEEACKGGVTMVQLREKNTGGRDYLEKACNLMLQHKSPDTVCGIVGNIGREGEEARVMTLEELKTTQVDMFTTVFIGNSQTKNIGGKMVTPRGYKNV